MWRTIVSLDGVYEEVVVDFDPYLKWLGIPPDEQPPDHYRLLAIPRFTSDAEVIDNAADQRMAHLKSLQLGPKAELSQTLLNQVAAARACLLNANRRADYDAQLKAQVEPAPKVESDSLFLSVTTERVVSFPPMQPGAPLLSVEDHDSPEELRSGLARLTMIVAGGVAGLTAGWLIVSSFITSGPNRPPKSVALVPADKEASPPFKFKASAATSDPVSLHPRPVVSSVRMQPPFDGKPLMKSPSVVSKTTAEPTKLESTGEVKHRLEAERDNAVRGENLSAALAAVGELMKLTDGDELEAKLAFLSGWVPDSVAIRREVAEELANQLDLALSEKDRRIAGDHTVALLRMARSLGDRELERRATIIVLKARQRSAVVEETD